MKKIKIVIIFMIWVLFMLFIGHKTENQPSYQEKILKILNLYPID